MQDQKCVALTMHASLTASTLQAKTITDFRGNFPLRGNVYTYENFSFFVDGLMARKVPGLFRWDLSALEVAVSGLFL